uniref:Uncharacterized protein n=1 Tax=Cucumis melo TaxID=3656 RepID=A0A9I9EF14_CUCME
MIFSSNFSGRLQSLLDTGGKRWRNPLNILKFRDITITLLDVVSWKH